MSRLIRYLIHFYYWSCGNICLGLVVFGKPFLWFFVFRVLNIVSDISKSTFCSSLTDSTSLSGLRSSRVGKNIPLENGLVVTTDFKDWRHPMSLEERSVPWGWNGSISTTLFPVREISEVLTTTIPYPKIHPPHSLVRRSTNNDNRKERMESAGYVPPGVKNFFDVLFSSQLPFCPKFPLWTVKMRSYRGEGLFLYFMSTSSGLEPGHSFFFFGTVRCQCWPWKSTHYLSGLV